VNVNFFTTTPSTTFTQWAPDAAEFGEITQYKGHYAIQGHSRSPIFVPIESSYYFLLVIDTNLPPILHRFWDIAFDKSKIAIFGYLSMCLIPPVEGFPRDDLRKIFHGRQ